MTEELKVELPEPEKHWEYRPEWTAWWLMVSDGPITAVRGFGPFNETEAQWAGEIHGVPFRRSKP